MDPEGAKRGRHRPEVLDTQALANLAKDLPDEDRALFACLVLTGARISEALSLTRASFNFDIADDPLLAGRGLATVTLRTEKREGQPTRIVPFVAFSTGEAILFKWLREFVESKDVDSLLWPMKRTCVKERFVKLTFKAYCRKHKEQAYCQCHVHPHYLRHCRATHLVSSYGMPESVLKVTMGWAPQTRTPEKYLHLNWRDAAKYLTRQW